MVALLLTPFGLVGTAGDALALTQPGGATIPTPPGCNSGAPTGLAAAFACVCDAPGVCNIGAACTSPTSCDDGKHAICETTLAHAYNDNTCIPSKLAGLDPIAEARTTPETFRPTCALTFTVVTRGTALFRDGFGWYNVTSNGQKPDASDLHGMIGCNDAAGKSVVLDIQADPAYRGGEVGFFLVTPESLSQKSQCAGGDCCATLARAATGQGQIYYSERKYNPDQASANALIHLLVFDSKITPRKFYFAWEDIYGASNNDFTDLVTSVDGVECSGGGVACATGKKGRCSVGVKTCASGALGCTPVFQGEPEVCDGVDNDCNGNVDDGATCAAADAICQNGECVHKCGGNEFPCKIPGTACDQATGFCVDPTCIGVTCGADQICHKGKCGAPCEGVVCPKGQTCTGAACVDLCSTKTCPSGQACKDGICFAGCAQCGGLACTTPETCNTATGTCSDTSCTTSCPGGTRCEAGQCKNACDGVTCPNGTTCEKGQCGSATTTSTGADGGLVDPGSGTAQGSDAGLEAGADDGNAYGNDRTGGCSCRNAVGHGNRGWAAAVLMGMGIGFAAKRRRSGRR